jgi:hypothetical protein
MHGGSLSHPEYGIDKEVDHYHTNIADVAGTKLLLLTLLLLHGLCHNVQPYLNLRTKKDII